MFDEWPSQEVWLGARKGGRAGSFSLEGRTGRLFASPEHEARILAQG